MCLTKQIPGNTVDPDPMTLAENTNPLVEVCIMVLYTHPQHTCGPLLTIMLQKPFPFLNLPPDIRNTIYRHTLVHPDATDMASQPALTRLNQQIRTECLPIYNGENRFSFLLGRPSTL